MIFISTNTREFALNNLRIDRITYVIPYLLNILEQTDIYNEVYPEIYREIA